MLIVAEESIQGTLVHHQGERFLRSGGGLFLGIEETTEDPQLHQ